MIRNVRILKCLFCIGIIKIIPTYNIGIINLYVEHYSQIL